MTTCVTYLQLSWRRFFFLFLSVSLLLLCASWFVFSPTPAHAAGTTYYVATNGNDGNSGTSPGSAFQHIQKCASVAVAGDTCLVEGGSYHEAVTPANSGNSSAPITYKPDNGASVTIDGADPVSGWSLSSGDVYTANVTLPVTGPQDTGFLANQVFVDGEMMNEARWPKAGLDQLHPNWATAGANTTLTTLYDSNLPNIDWTGAILHLGGGSDPFSMETGVVTASSSGQLTISGLQSSACPYICLQSGARYYLTGAADALTSPSEWYYNGGSNQLSLWAPASDSPANHTVEAKERNYAFNLAGRSYINVSGFTLFAATITTDSNSTHDTLDSLNASYLSHYMTLPIPPSGTLAHSGDGFDFIASHEEDSGIVLNGSYNTLSNSVLAYSAGNGVVVMGSNNTVTNNLIHDVDYMGDYAAGISIAGSYQAITHNTVYNTGRDNVTVDWHIAGETFQNNTISYNDLSVAGLLTIDGGDLYACCSLDASGTSIDHNWTHDLAVKSGVSGFAGAGIYIDNNSGHFLVHHNVSWNNQGAGLDFNGQGGASQYNEIYNNTVGGGQSVSLSYPASDATGSNIINNIFTGSADSPTYATISHNLSSSTNPQFVNASANDYHLQSSSPAIDAGQTVSGITNGYAGSAPDEGAYEYNGANWVPGCGLDACTIPVSVDDSVQGSGQNQFSYSGSGWAHCTGCPGFNFYNDSLSYDNTTNDTVSFAFVGTGIRLYIAKDYNAGIDGIKIDGGSETYVDGYAPIAPAIHGDQQVWTSPTLSSGSHTLTLRVTGTHDASSTDNYLALDRVDVLTRVSTVDDAVQGSGQNQFNYSGGGWAHCSGSCGGTAYFDSTVSYDNTTNDSVTISFTGSGILLYAGEWSASGIAAVSLDGGAETNLDLYAVPSLPNALVWRTSPNLAWGAHTLKVRVTGTRDGSSTDNYIPIDRCAILP